jgi:hypothetical protein
MKVGEIAAAAAGNENFLADAVRVFEDRGAAAAFSGFDGAQQSRRAATKYKHIELAFHGWNGDGRSSIFHVIFGAAIVNGKPGLFCHLRDVRCYWANPLDAER